MKRATITIPDELEAKLEEYVRRQDVPPALTAVARTALMEFLERRERFGGREVRPATGPLRITPIKEKDSLGESDVSVNHDEYLAETTYEDSFNEK